MNDWSSRVLHCPARQYCGNFERSQAFRNIGLINYTYHDISSSLKHGIGTNISQVTKGWLSEHHIWYSDNWTNVVLILLQCCFNVSCVGWDITQPRIIGKLRSKLPRKTKRHYLLTSQSKRQYLLTLQSQKAVYTYITKPKDSTCLLHQAKKQYLLTLYCFADRAKRQYLFTCKVSRYCFLAL